MIYNDFLRCALSFVSPVDINMCFLFCILKEGGNMRKGIVAGGGYCNGINNIPSLAQICKAWNALVGKLYRFWKKYHPLSLSEKERVQ